MVSAVFSGARVERLVAQRYRVSTSVVSEGPAGAADDNKRLRVNDAAASAVMPDFQSTMEFFSQATIYNVLQAALNSTSSCTAEAKFTLESMAVQSVLVSTYLGLAYAATGQYSFTVTAQAAAHLRDINLFLNQFSDPSNLDWGKGCSESSWAWLGHIAKLKDSIGAKRPFMAMPPIPSGPPI